MVNKMSLQESILNAVNTIVEQRTNELKVDKTITAIIEKNMGVFSGKTLYKVSYDGGFFEAIALNTDEIYSPNTPVYVLIPQGNFSKEKVIIGRANNINLEDESTIVASTINQYSLVGSNLLYNAHKDNDIFPSDLQYGVYSYHNPTEENDNPNSILHRYNQICSYNSEIEDYEESFERDQISSINKIIYNQNLAFNQEDLNILKEEATSLMLKADFKTILTREQRQQAQGEYGLILNLVFNNLNKDYGATNGEVFEKISDIIVGETYISSEQAENFNGIKSIRSGNATNTSYDYYSVKLKDIHDYYINQILNNGEDIKNNIRLLIEYTNDLKTAFSTNNSTKVLYTDIVDNTLTAYLSFLNELELCNNKENFENKYNDWWNQIIGDTADKIISYKFSSNNMIGNPLSFNYWNTQYQILNVDIKNLIRIDSIILYKQGFIEDTESELNWPLNSPGPDIFVKNLQIYPVKPIDGEYGDYTLKVQPKDLNNGFNSGILTSIEATDIVTFEAIFMRKMLENLSANTRVSYNWFKEDCSVIDTDSFGYDAMAGTGWQKIRNAKNSTFITSGSNNLAYKNNYKCVVQYIESENNIITLDTIFIIYNKSVGTSVLLESDLGTVFSFDAGIPEITCKINENSNNSDTLEDYQEIIITEDNNETYPRYKYYWAITDAANGNKIFLNEINNINESSTNNIMVYNTAKHIIDKIGYYKILKINNSLEKIRTDNSIEATRINYPVNKLSSGFVVECYVKKRMSILGSNEIRYVDIGSASLEFLNKGLDIGLNNFKLIIENGNQVFQYDEYGNAPNDISKKEPLNILPLHAKILAPSGIEIKNSNYFVEWIFPTENTMIIAGEVLETNPSTQIPQLYRGLSCSFDISNLYNPDYWNNQITCHVRYNNQDLYKDTEFTFTKIGENGTNGTDVVAKIYYTGNDILNTLHSEPLTIYAQDQEDNNSQIITKAMFNVPNGNGRIRTLETSLPVIGDTGILDVALYQKGKILSVDNYASTYPRWNLLGNSSYSTNYGKYFSIQKNNNNYNIEWQASYRSDNENPLYQIIKAEVQLKTGQTYYATYNIPFIWYTNNSESILNLDHYIAIDKNSYLSSILYNADGRNPIYNHSQGLKFINIPSNVTKIKWQAKTEDDEKNACFNFIEEDGSLKSVIEKRENIESQEMVNILPNDVYDGGITNNYIEATFYNEENEIIAIAYVPIYMSLNTFGLASLNAWDGNHVTVNEDEGYIMSPQIGAGEKDENNRFTGILMGKTEGNVGHTGETESQTGLFGYAHGIQSIFLDAKTGNATFGLPNGLHLKENGDLEESNNFNEGRIELRPGGESVIGGWTLGNKSLYYTSKKDEKGEWVHSGELESRKALNYKDYVPNWRTGLIEEDLNNSYFKHHERDIKSEESGILLYAGESPYISIKGRPFTANDIPYITGDNNNIEQESFIKEEDSIELQLDPATPTLFTIFRHNGGLREGIEGTVGDNERYEEGSRTFLAGINSKGEFIANGLRNANTTDIDISVGDNATATWKAGSLVTKFAVNALNAFGDFGSSNPKPSHVGFEITANETNTLAHFFTKINGLNVNSGNTIDASYDPTLHISGGYTESEGEYSRPLALHGKNIQMYAIDGTIIDNDSNKYLSKTDANLKISTNNFELQLGPTTKFNLYRNKDNNNLMTAKNLNINVGAQVSSQYEVEEVKINNQWISLDSFPIEQKLKRFSGAKCFIEDSKDDKSIVKKDSKNFYYINLEWMKYFSSNWDKISPKYAIYADGATYKCLSSNNTTVFYYRTKDKEKNSYSYILVDSYNDNTKTVYITNNQAIGEENRKIQKSNIYEKNNNEYIKINSDENIGNNKNDLSRYYIEIPKTELEIEQERYDYISRRDFNQNLYYSSDGQEENKKQVLNIEDIYLRRLDEQGNFIYINKNNFNNNSGPFIKISYTEGQTPKTYYYLKDNFEGNYFRLDSNNNSYYVSGFYLIKRNSDEVEEQIKYFSANPENKEDYNYTWNQSFFDVLSENPSIRYYIQFEYDNESRQVEITADNPIVDFSATTQDKVKNLNIYSWYDDDNNDDRRRFILRNDINTNNIYYRYIEDQNTVYYSNFIDETSNTKEYYKCKNDGDGYIEIKTNIGQLYFCNNDQEYFQLNDENIDQKNTYILDSATGQYTINKNNSSSELFYRYIKRIDISSKKWITLYLWLGEKCNFYEYCQDVNKEYKRKSLFNTQDRYIYTNKKYQKFTGSVYNYNYALFEDSQTGTKFYVSKTEFENVYKDITNRQLLYNKTIIDIGNKASNKNWQKRTISTSYSQESYKIYSGTYQSYIQKNNNFTNTDITNTNIQIKNTRPFNFFTNKAINIFYVNTENSGILNNSSSNLFNKKFCLNDSGISLIGKIENKTYGFILDNYYNLTLESRSNSYIKSKNTIEINATELGNGIAYNIKEPQISLKAGGTAKNATQLMLNSSNNGWANDKKNSTSYPVFRIKTRYSGIGIYPEYINKDDYSEYFLVNMSQVINEGLSIEGKYRNSMDNTGLIVKNNIQAAKFVGTKKDSFVDRFPLDKKIFGSSNQIISGIGKKGTFKFPKITITDANGRLKIEESSVTVDIPDADTIWSAIKNTWAFQDYISQYLTRTDAKNTYAQIEHQHSQYSLVGHTHSQYARDPHTHNQYVTSISPSGANSITYYTGNGSVTVSIPIKVPPANASTT